MGIYSFVETNYNKARNISRIAGTLWDFKYYNIENEIGVTLKASAVQGIKKEN